MKPFDLEAFKAGAIATTSGRTEIYFLAEFPDGRIAYRYIWLDHWHCSSSELNELKNWNMKPVKRTMHYASWKAGSAMSAAVRICSNMYTDKSQLAIFEDCGRDDFQYHTIEIEE